MSEHARVAGLCPFEASKFDPATTPTPHDVLKEARESSTSTFFVKDYGFWAVTAYDDVVEALSNYEIFSSAKMIRVWAPPPETAPDLPDGHPLEGAPVSTDPPRHTRIRKLAQKAFTPGMVAQREGAIRGLVDRIMDKFISKGSVDLVREYCSVVPPAVVSQLLGVPEEDAGTFRKWALDAHHLAFSKPTLPAEELLRLSREMVHFDQYVRRLIAARREKPQEDLTSYLVHAKSDEGEPSLNAKELISIIASMVTAGSDTTSTLIAHAVYVLLTDTETRRAIDADRSLIDNLIEETLRVYPSARAMRRTTRCPVQIGGSDVPADATMLVHLASANRDPKVFKDPDRFDIRRHNAKRHMSFGIGTHFCLGAPLARLETVAAIEALLDRIPTMRLAPGVKLDTSIYDHNMFIPSIETMKVEWDVTA